MATLLLRLAGPLQAWGVDSKFDTRRTERLPSKSGVVGLLAAALGRRRDEEVSDLNALRFGVRVEQEGTILRDYHTAKSEKASYVTERYYLEDAIFLVGLEGSSTLLHELSEALLAPAFPLFLGRRSCPPTLPLVMGVFDTELLTTLRDYPWQAAEWWKKKHANARLRLVTDALPGSAGYGIQRDVPVSLNPEGRSYTWRSVQEHPPVQVGQTAELSETEHDPLAEL